MDVILPRIGATLRRERELRKVTLEEIASSTRIPIRTLQHMEDDEWDALPGRVFAKGFLKGYAYALGLDARPLLLRFERAELQQQTQQPMPLSTGPHDRGRRFGVAIAVVVLLVLFSLALSIVLRPRERDVPVELSQTSVVLDSRA